MSSSSLPTAPSEEFELAQYEKIMQLHDKIMSGRHSQFKPPMPPTSRVQVSATSYTGSNDSKTSKLPQMGTKRFNVVSTFEIEIDGNCDYYEILGVKSNATVDEITKSYEALKNAQNTSTGPSGHGLKLLGSGAEFEKKIKEAHYILSIHQLRQQYDEMKGKALSGPSPDLPVRNVSTGQSQHRIPVYIPENAAADVNRGSLGSTPACHNDRPSASRQCSSSGPQAANGPGWEGSHQDRENREASQLQERSRGNQERNALERRGSDMNHSRDYYKVLGVDDSCKTTQESIYRAFKYKHREYSPSSRFAESKWRSSSIGIRREVERRWEELQDAYYTLRDVARRERYDMERAKRGKTTAVAPPRLLESNQGEKMQAANFNPPSGPLGRVSSHQHSSNTGAARQPPTPTVLTPASTLHPAYPADAHSPSLTQKPPLSSLQEAPLNHDPPTSSGTASRIDPSRRPLSPRSGHRSHASRVFRRPSRLNGRRRRGARRMGDRITASAPVSGGTLRN